MQSVKLPDAHMARGQAAGRPHGRGGRGRAEIAVVSAQLIHLDLREVCSAGAKWSRDDINDSRGGGGGGGDGGW